jgi:Ca-activated chloride channel homolog
MEGRKLQEAKKAAVNFVQRQDLSRHQVALVSFESVPHRLSGLSQSAADFSIAVDRIAKGGSTRMDIGLSAAADILRGATNQKVILMFTDGMPDDKNTTLSTAANVKSAGIKIVTVATDDADVRYLSSVTGDRSRVFYTSSGQYEKGFLQAENVIFNRQLFETTTGSYSYREALARVAGWTAWLSLGAALALSVGQFLIVKRRSLPFLQIGKIAAGASLAGFLAGGAGQVLYSVISFLPSSDAIVRILAWALLGSILGRGMGYIIPNLESKKSMVGGALGASLGAVAFLFVSHAIGDSLGRIIGALLVGAALGLCVGIVEMLFREAWLTVAFGPKEIITVTLGRDPVRIGGGPDSTVYVAQGASVDVEYTLEGSRLACLDKTSGVKETPTPGEWKKLGNVAVAVNTPDAKADLSALESLWPPAASKPTPSKTKVEVVEVEVANYQVETLKTEFVLCMDSGKGIVLDVGVSIFGSDLGEPGMGAAQAVAQVQGHPTNKQVRGLVNLSIHAWEARNSQGDRKTITKGMTITLKDGLSIKFGTVSGSIRCRI